MGRYEVTGELGRGSMGIVHRAHDPVMGRDVALKTILIPHGLPQDKKQEFQERFLREAQAAGRLSHPGIVTVYDFNKDGDDDRPYIAMEFVQGSTLHDLIANEGPLKPEWVLAIGDTLADALQTACQAGIIHRDLKPANILVREADGVAKITDFGIARVNHSELTNAGTTYGSPAYMAPERIRGQQADLRSDLFSLGVILYEALCGKRPFGGDDFASICFSLLNDPPISIRGRVPGLTPAFDAFFDMALAKNPNERFQSGAEFREALESVKHQQVLFSSGAATMQMPTSMRHYAEGDPPSDAGPSGSNGTSSLAGVALEPRSAAVDEDDATVLPRRPRVAVAPPAPGSYKRLLHLGSIGLLCVVVCLLLLRGNEEPGAPTGEGPLVGPEVASEVAGQAPGADGAAKAPSSAPSTKKPGAATSTAQAKNRTAAHAPVKPPALAERPKKLKPAASTQVTAAEPPPTAVVAAPEADATEGDATPAPAEEALSVGAPVVEKAVRPVTSRVLLQVSIKSNVRAGRLQLLADGNEIFASTLDTDKKGLSIAYKRVVGKGQEALDAEVEVPAATRELTVRVFSEAKERWFEDRLDVTLTPGESVDLQIVAGRALGDWLSITRR